MLHFLHNYNPILFLQHLTFRASLEKYYILAIYEQESACLLLPHLIRFKILFVSIRMKNLYFDFELKFSCQEL